MRINVRSNNSLPSLSLSRLPSPCGRCLRRVPPLECWRIENDEQGNPKCHIWFFFFASFFKRKKQSSFKISLLKHRLPYFRSTGSNTSISDHFPTARLRPAFPEKISRKCIFGLLTEQVPDCLRTEPWCESPVSTCGISNELQLVVEVVQHWWSSDCWFSSFLQNTSGFTQFPTKKSGCPSGSKGSVPSRWDSCSRKFCFPGVLYNREAFIVLGLNRGSDSESCSLNLGIASPLDRITFCRYPQASDWQVPG